MKLIIPILLAVLGLVGGAGAGWYLKPAPEPVLEPCLDEQGNEQDPELCTAEHDAQAEDDGYGEGTDNSQFITLDRQFIVPIVADDRVAAMMVMSINLEVAPGSVETAFRNEPKLRDMMLRALFEHAYTGGFSGDFTAEHLVRELRGNLLAAGREVIGNDLRNVLIADMIRQEQ